MFTDSLNSAAYKLHLGIFALRNNYILYLNSKSMVHTPTFMAALF